MKNWCLKIDDKNRDVLEKWRNSQLDYNEKSTCGFEGWLLSDKRDGTYTIWASCPPRAYTEITFEQFLLMQSNIDYTIAGTKLPTIPEGIEYRAIHWGGGGKEKTNHTNIDLFSFGSKIYKNEVYILAEEKDYNDTFHYMFKLSDIETLIENKNQKIMKAITHTQAQQIIDIACATWKEQLAIKWGRKIVLKEPIEISDNEYQEMRKFCAKEQNELFDIIFGKFKVGEWVIGWFCDSYDYKTTAWEIGKIEGSFVYPKKNIEHNSDYKNIRLATEEEIQKAKFIPEGTACLVRDYDNESWKLLYSDGYGKFKGASNLNISWKYVQVLDINNLPKY